MLRLCLIIGNKNNSVLELLIALHRRIILGAFISIFFWLSCRIGSCLVTRVFLNNGDLKHVSLLCIEYGKEESPFSLCACPVLGGCQINTAVINDESKNQRLDFSLHVGSLCRDVAADRACCPGVGPCQ